MFWTCHHFKSLCFILKEKQSQAEEKREKKRAKAFIPPKERPHAPKPVTQGSFVFHSHSIDRSTHGFTTDSNFVISFQIGQIIQEHGNK